MPWGRHWSWFLYIQFDLPGSRFPIPFRPTSLFGSLYRPGYNPSFIGVHQHFNRTKLFNFKRNSTLMSNLLYKSIKSFYIWLFYWLRSWNCSANERMTYTSHTRTAYMNENVHSFAHPNPMHDERRIVDIVCRYAVGWIHERRSFSMLNIFGCRCALPKWANACCRSHRFWLDKMNLFHVRRSTLIALWM